jgi:hypothetical protein
MDVMMMMMVMMVASQHERSKLRDHGHVVNSKDSIRIIGFRNATAGYFVMSLWPIPTTAIGSRKTFLK